MGAVRPKLRPRVTSEASAPSGLIRAGRSPPESRGPDGRRVSLPPVSGGIGVRLPAAAPQHGGTGGRGSPRQAGRGTVSGQAAQQRRRLRLKKSCRAPVSATIFGVGAPLPLSPPVQARLRYTAPSLGKRLVAPGSVRAGLSHGRRPGSTMVRLQRVGQQRRPICSRVFN
ncbi:hypothetical protein NDU88_004157 [Pleurodeles waltl]|uniref:Uncharacterized protein n=1 Tax=Pleurodeles waltl TaxID=8319 RepID=A0AAV7UFB4_PLEWA|nr:hypothetical protein NDU88_004157 [Pleurodeles waltl]